MTQGLQVDATFNRGSNFTKNNCEKRYPEIYQTKKQSVVFRHEDPYRHRCQKWLDPESGNHVSQRVRPPSDGQPAQWQGTEFVFTDAGYQGLSSRASCSIFWPAGHSLLSHSGHLCGAHSKVVGFAGVWRVGLGKGAQPAVPDPTRLSGCGHRGAGLAFFDDSNVHAEAMATALAGPALGGRAFLLEQQVR